LKIADALLRMLFLVVGISSAVLALGFPSSCFADGATITADKLEYFKEEQRYVATGNVKIVKGSAVITADSAVYFDETADSELTGHVTIDDKDYLINTEQAEFNLDDNTGTLNNAVIYFKKDRYWINGSNMQKLGDNKYHAKTAYFTGCDSEAYRTVKVLTSEKVPASQKPDWCFKGDDADIVVGDEMSAKNATYRIKETPVFYTPYFWTGIGRDRVTGFEVPAVGNDSRKGVRYSQSFFWAIDENKDATFGLDYFSRRGVGTGVEYRFLDFNHEGKWYAYHIGDSELHQSFWEVKVTDKYKTGNLQAFLDVNYINSETYYKEYPKDFATTISRFLQSTGEVSLPFDNSRVYLLAQHWVNLREGVTEHVPQKLPELGYVINPTSFGPAIFSLQANAANFYREQDPSGQRLDIQPTLSYSFGDAIRLTQAVSLRETSYNLTNGGSFGSAPHREIFQYDAQAQMRFIKDYGAFLHIIEPSVEYTFIPSARIMPLFDSTELPIKTSLVTFSLFNKFVFKGLDVSLRLTQPYDFHSGNIISAADVANLENGLIDTTAVEHHSLQPTKLQGAVSGSALPVSFTFDAAYDFNSGSVNNLNSVAGFAVFRDITLGLGERYSRIDNLMLYTLGINVPMGNHWLMNIYTGYDAKGPGLREFAVRTSYKEQCWNIDILITRTPGDQIRPASYSYMIIVGLRGLGSYKL
jgi:LPS-assembly protein